MSDWFLVPALAKLRDEINAFAPNRDHTSDGAVGDSEHQREHSDHNPDSAGRVHAIDVDNSGPWPIDWSAERLTQFLIDRQRRGLDDRLQNVIYNRRIWSRTWGWGVQPYTGPSAHLEHIHFSARHDVTRDHTQPWGLLQEDDMTAADMLALLISPEGQAAIGRAVHGQKLGRSDVTIGQAVQTTYGNVAVLAKNTGVDEQTIIAGVLAGLSVEQIAANVIAALPADEAKKVADELAARLAA